MLSQEGVRQGCVLAAALFSIGTISIFNQCVQQHPDVHAVAIMDDLTLYGPQDSVLRCFDTLLQALQGTGLALNIAKNKVLWPSTSEPPSALFDSIKARGLSLELGSMEILGTMVGLDDKKIQTWILETVKSSQAQLFTSLLHEYLPVQCAMAVLRLCTVPKMTYLMRTVRPALL